MSAEPEPVMLNSVLLGGPKDGLRLTVPEYVEEMEIQIVSPSGDGRWHRYEFDPTTDRSGRWIYRYRGDGPRKGGGNE